MAYNGQASDQQFNAAVYGDLPSAEVLYRFTNLNRSQAFAFASVTSVQITSNVLTVTAVNTLSAGQIVQFYSMTGANAFLNGAVVLIASASGTQFTTNYVHANFGPSAEANGFVLLASQSVTLGVLSQEDPSVSGQVACSAFDAIISLDTANDYIMPVGNAPVVWPSNGITAGETTSLHEGTGRIYGSTPVQSIQVTSNVLTVTPQSGNRFSPWILGTSFIFEGFTTATYLNKAVITSISITSNVVTVTCANAFGSGQNIRMFGLTSATFLNWQTLTVTTASGTQFTAPFTHANYGPTADTGTAAPIVTSSAVSGYSGGGQATFSAPFTHADTGLVTDTTGVIIGGTFHALTGSVAAPAVQQNNGGVDMIVGAVIDIGNQGHTNNNVGLFFTQMGDQAGYADNSYCIYIQDQLQTARSHQTSTWAIYEAGTTNKNQLGEIQMGSLMTKYNSISTVDGGIPAIYASASATAQGADIGATTLYAVPASGAGIYRVSFYEIVTRAATTSSTLPAVVITWTDRDNSTAQSVTFTPSAAAGNTLTTFVSGDLYVSAKASTNIQYSTSGFASSGGTSMQFAIRLKAEALG